jgi:protein-S-isoprenylcysteine O-methyltransferase Ste14
MMLEVESICRIALGGLFVGAACIGIPHRRRADRVGGSVSRKEDPSWFWWWMSAVAPLMALACVAFLINPRWIDFAGIDLPAGLRLAGIPIGAAGLFVFGWMFRHLGLNVTSTSMPRANATLVTSGPYRWVRHPMYTAALILAAGAAMLTANLVVMIGGVLMFALLAARSRVEEQRLIEKFGEAYRRYQQGTGRFFPRV